MALADTITKAQGCHSSETNNFFDVSLTSKKFHWPSIRCLMMYTIHVCLLSFKLFEGYFAQRKRFPDFSRTLTLSEAPDTIKDFSWLFLDLEKLLFFRPNFPLIVATLNSGPFTHMKKKKRRTHTSLHLRTNFSHLAEHLSYYNIKWHDARRE